MDTTPTANSTVPVTSGGVAASQAEQDAEIAWNANQGVKNLIELSPNTYTSGNVVVKLNDDGTVSVSLSSGSTANTTFSRAIKTITNLRDMDLILNGCPSGGNYSSGYALYISDDSTTKEKDEGNGVLVPKNTTVTTSYLALIVRSGTAISGTLTFKPMIRPAFITDPTFQPYALSNPVITPALIEQVDNGAKNLLPITIQTQTVKTVVFTVNSDGTITANGTVTGGDAYLNLETLIGDKYTGNILSGGASNLKICISKGGSGQIAVYSESSEGVKIPDNATNTLFLFAANGTQLNNVTVKPMICTAADYAVSQKFVPYAPTNRELYSGELQYEVFDIVDNLNTTFVDKTNSRFKIYKYGRFCFADISLKLNTNNLTGNDTITSTALPEKMRPKFDFYGVMVARDNGTWGSANMLSVPFVVGATNGSVFLRTGAEHSSALYITATAVWPASNTAVAT